MSRESSEAKASRMAPAMIVAADARIVDLDGPLWMAKDRENGLAFDKGVMGLPDRALWG